MVNTVDRTPRYHLPLVLSLTLILLCSILPAHAQFRGFEVPNEGEPLEVGDSVEGRLDDDTVMLTYMVEAEEGDALTLYVEQEDFTTLYLVVANDLGDILAVSNRDTLFDVQARIFLFLVPEDGEYFIAVTTSSYYNLGEADREAEFVLTVESADYQLLEYGDAVEGELTEESPYNLYVFEVVQGDIPQIILQSRNSDVEVSSLSDPEFSNRSGNNPVASTDDYVSPFYLFEDDLLYILVYNNRFDPADEYTLSLQRYEPLLIESGETLEVPLVIETVSNFVAFEAERNQRVSIRGESPENVSARIAVFDPDGRVIAVEDAADGVSDLRLREDGLYIIQVFPGGFLIDISNLGVVELTLEIDD